MRNPSIDTVFFGGAAGGGKSWCLCETRLVNAIAYPGYKSFIGREELKRLMQSTYITWCKVCQWHKIPQDFWKLNGQYNYIEFTNGSRIDLLDLKYLPTDPMYERFGSLEYTDGAIEEAGEVDFLAYDVLKSRIGRHNNDELKLHPSIFITGNPKKNWTYNLFYKKWRNKELSNNIAFIQSLYTDNPYTAESYGKQLASITDKVTKQRLMLGIWEYDNTDDSLINYEAINDLFTNTLEPSGDKFLTADIARYGGDKIVIYCWRGFEAYRTVVYQRQGIDTTAENIKEILVSERIPYSHCIVDDDGVGGGVVDILRGIKGFRNNSVPLERRDGVKENYQNLKAQCYYLLAEKINRRDISVKNVSQEIKDKLIEELEQVRRKDADKDGKLALIGKDEIKEIIGRSPDYADALMMRMYFELKPSSTKVGLMNRPKVNYPTSR